MKNVVVLFDAPGFTSEQFDKVWEDLKAAGQEHPKRLISHVSFENPNGNWNVVDVWDSAESFAEFGKTLKPIFEKNEVKSPEPLVLPAHFVYQPLPENVHA